MKCKKLVSLFLSLLLATALAVPACAAFEDVFADGSADGTRDGSLFLSGETVRSSAAVNTSTHARTFTVSGLLHIRCLLAKRHLRVISQK